MVAAASTQLRLFRSARRVALSVAEAAGALGCSPDLVYGAIKRGDLPARRIGERRLLIGIKALEKWANRPDNQPGPAAGTDA